MKWPEKVIFCEVGPRDGLQNEPSILPVDKKIKLTEGAAAAGVKIIEIGSFMNSKAVPQMADTDESVTKVKLVLSASEAHAMANLKKTIAQLLEGFKECAEFATANGVEVSGAISTAFGCPFEGDVPAPKVLDIASKMRALGLTELSLSDTTGMANPRQVYDLSRAARKEFPDVRWFLHFHNTRGMALARQLEGWAGHSDSAILKAGTNAELVPMTAAKKQPEKG